MDLWEYIFNLISNNKDLTYGGYILLFGVMIYFLLKNDKEEININKRIGILNIILFLICFFNILDSFYALLVYLAVIFIYFLILHPIIFKDGYLKHPLMFIIDYLYKLFVDYGFVYLFISIIFCSDFFRLRINDQNYLNVYLWATLFLGGYFVCRSTICCVNKDDFKTEVLDNIFNKVISKMNYNDFDYYKNDKFIKFSSMLVYREDRSYFERINSYNWFCMSFVWYRIKRFFKYGTEFKIYYNRYIGKISYVFIMIFHTYWVFLKTYDSIMEFICDASVYVFRCVFIRKTNPHIIRHMFRGYSTIEMQLIRTLAVDKKSYSLYPEKRKMFELCYSYIFFNCLKDYFKKDSSFESINPHYFKYYLLYIYIETVPVKINGKEYSNIHELFNKDDLFDISYEEFYIWINGLSHTPIKDYLLDSPVVEWNNLDKVELKMLIDKFNSKKVD